MMFKKKLLSFIIFFSIICTLAAVSNDSNGASGSASGPVDNFKCYHGKRVLENNNKFSLIGLRIYLQEENIVFVDLIFTEEINSMSTKADSLIINHTESGTKITTDNYRFSKSSRGIRFEFSTNQFVNMPLEACSLSIQNIFSWDGTCMEAVKIDNLKYGYQYHYSEKEKKWVNRLIDDSIKKGKSN